ncbi:DUF4386 domain-containing protein [Nioella sediminis]|jgi:hypothetical protein|uniref:DUF4386 domain-containing protein n=1 Tax=Nioella sediminis TaxID=1912092 RepID=UPI0008FD8A2F|nr:DUF4386 domain-containing protein [Nioella sediminis]TBX27538.1 hypothetical protein TK43_10200 [Roseovarius sp. JS7-11]
MPQSHTPRQAQGAGLLYLVIIIAGLSSELLLRGPLIVQADAVQTASNIQAHLSGFRLSLLLDLVMILSDVALACLLYLIFAPLSPVLAILMSAFRMVQAAVLGANLFNQTMALNLLTFEGDLPGREALAMASLQLQAQGYDLGLALFGLSCGFLALILLRGQALPRWIGWLMAGAAPIYITGAILRIIAPDLMSVFEPAYIVPVVAELSFCLWLLIAAPRRLTPRP